LALGAFLVQAGGGSLNSLCDCHLSSSAFHVS
jgi:hypothetical protein